ncbi:MAG: hypothetical protein ABSH15_04390 [Verrucomicrobiota bacterium]|jgi:hypothetical protein
MKTYDEVYEACQAGGMNNTESDEVAREQAARCASTYDEILGAVMRATTIDEVRSFRRLAEDMCSRDELSTNQLAMLRSSMNLREEAIATLATI